MKNFIITLAFLGMTSFVVAQSQMSEAELFYNTTKEQAYFVHDVQVKETLYAISKSYGASIPAIMAANDMKTPALSIGQKIIVPFVVNAVDYQVSDRNKKERTVIFYTVRKKETVYRICRKYFELNLTAIKELNDLKNNSLDIDQKLIIGYLPDLRLEKNDPVKEKQEEAYLPSMPSTNRMTATSDDTIEPPAPEAELISNVPSDAHLYAISTENGAAFWNKQASGLSGYYVLHRYAEVNTWIEVTNPMYKKSIRARVLGNIPEGTYPNDVLVVVSPSIAKDLGALDERFYVKVRYLQLQSKLTKGK